MVKKTVKPEVTIILPFFNAEKYLTECLDSIYAQTFQDFELLAVNDGSNDGSLVVVQKYAKTHKGITIISQNNHGQGCARNKALKQAAGEYILFVDADDLIKPELLETCLKDIKAKQADVVHFNWEMLQHKTSSPYIEQFNKMPFNGQKLLVAEECEQLLKKANYYAWDSLYRTDFLKKNNIRFGEHRVYEDNRFIVGVASYANRIAIIDTPLYTVRNNSGSSSRSNYNNDLHYKDFITAMNESWGVLIRRTDYTSFYLAAYFLEKFLVYYGSRIPDDCKKRFLRDFVNITGQQKLVSPVESADYKFLRQCIRHCVFIKQKYVLFSIGVFYKISILPKMSRLYKVQRN